MLKDSEQKISSHRKKSLVRGMTHPSKGQASHSIGIGENSNASVQNLLQFLADNNSSRSVKEQLHSRLLSGTLSSTSTMQSSSRDVEMQRLLERRLTEPVSHFSDSSDDETTEDSKGETGSSSNASSSSSVKQNHICQAQSKRAQRSNRLRNAEPQDVFDLEI